MSAITLGLICGLVFGIIDVLVMLPIKVADKRKRLEALIGAFIERFMLGFIIPNVAISLHPAIVGAILGIGFSVPTAIITRAYAPIIGMGVVGGVLIGFITNWVLL